VRFQPARVGTFSTGLDTLDVTAANLAIETFLPMDPKSAARLAELSAPRSA
jgi:hypothetical protein